jgi:hypothetical protein
VTRRRTENLNDRAGRLLRLTARDTDAYFAHDASNVVDDLASRTSIHAHRTTNEGDDACACLLSDAAFDILGAVRWLRDPATISLARQAVASALVELTIAAARLEVR